MLTMVNQKGRLYTINHLHHPQHSQQPESLHMTAAEYLVASKAMHAYPQKTEITGQLLLVQCLVLPNWSRRPSLQFMQVPASIAAIV